MADQFLTLSLFLMLLSFFIILSSMSEFEISKAESALSSVSVAFSKQAKSGGEKSSHMDFVKSKSINKGTALDQIQSLFTAQLTGLKASQNRLGTEMQVRLKVKDFEKLLSASALGNARGSVDDERNLLPVMVSLMDSVNSIPYRMDIVVHTAENPANAQNNNPDQMRLTTRSASNYATTIENMGLPRKLVSSGLKEGREGEMDLVFKRYIPFDPSTQATKNTQKDLPAGDQ